LTWKSVLGRVSFINCDPVFHSIEGDWRLLSAPPSWLTGHLLRRDCLTAPIPTADYAKNSDELCLLPDIAIVSKGDVGSVLLFGNREVEAMRDIAIPTDSSTSIKLLKWILGKRGLDPRLIEMGPEINTMLRKCDGALLIGDRALDAALEGPDTVKLDLGKEWVRITGFPMVFGVFAARKDSPSEMITKAYNDMLFQYRSFINDEAVRNQVIMASSKKLHYPESRVERYFADEVSNLFGEDGIEGLGYFLTEVCGMTERPTWFQPIHSV